MSQPSTAWTDLGGGQPAVHSVGITAKHRRHRFSPTSGWCACGLRDDGQLAEYSPAWRDQRASRAELETAERDTHDHTHV